MRLLLYKKAIQLADISKKDTVIDAYCGIGTIGIVASKKAGKVIGVELNSEAVSDAKINASINNIKNATFVNADAGDFLVEYAKNERQMLLSWIRPEVEAHRNSLILFLRLSQTGLCIFHAVQIHRQGI